MAVLIEPNLGIEREEESNDESDDEEAEGESQKFYNPGGDKLTSYKPNPKAIEGLEEGDEGASVHYRYQLQHIYERAYDKSTIVWEIACPRPILESQLKDPKADNTTYSREELSDSLEKALMNLPSHCKGSQFWQWVEKLDDFHFFTLYDRILNDLVEANGHLASFNALLSYCTGSHNNCQMLGGIVQAKGA
jgi:hypothetical protein